MQQSLRDYEDLPMKCENNKVTNKQCKNTYTTITLWVEPEEKIEKILKGELLYND